jgi:ATP phosphoribosyltransferase regulatory subunit HisZ
LYQRDDVAAESLYQRALGIQERALGPDSDDVAATLGAYAELLRTVHREEQATDLSTRAGAIRTGAEQRRQQETETSAETGAPPEGAEPVIASAIIMLAADEGEGAELSDTPRRDGS